MQWCDVVSVIGGNLLLVQSTGGGDSSMQPDFFAAFMRMTAVLALIVGLLLAIAAALKRFHIMNRSPFGSHRSIRVLETTYLGPKQSLVLVQAGRDVLLLGMTQQSITFLSKIEFLSRDQEVSVHEPEQDFAAVLGSALVHECHNGLKKENPDLVRKPSLGRFIARFTLHRLGR